MNFGILLSFIIGSLGTSTIVAINSYKSAPEPIEAGSGHGNSDAVTPAPKLKLKALKERVEKQ